MPKFMGGFSSSKSWSRQAAVPKCGPSKSEMTLIAAAEEQNRRNRAAAANGRALRRAEAELATAQKRNNKNGIRIAQQKIGRIRKRG